MASNKKGEENANHLIGDLKSLYKVTTDWKGELYCGITLKWDYDAHTVNLSVPGYVEAQLHKYHNQKPLQTEHSPYRYDQPQYGVKQKITKESNTSELLSDYENRRTKQVVGLILCMPAPSTQTCASPSATLPPRRRQGLGTWPRRSARVSTNEPPTQTPSSDTTPTEWYYKLPDIPLTPLPPKLSTALAANITTPATISHSFNHIASGYLFLSDKPAIIIAPQFLTRIL